MNITIQIFLLSHVLFGVIGILSFYFITIEFFKKTVGIRLIRMLSVLGTFAFFASWFSGGFYYTTYYGASVKPRIIEGNFSFAHKIIMESKEHVFLFLPFLTITFAIAVFLLGDTIVKDEDLRKSLRFLSLIIFILGLFIGASGILISGAVS